MLRVSPWLAITGVIAVAACNRDHNVTAGKDAEDISGTTNLTQATFTTRDSAVDRITAARCAREVTCSNIGPDKHFTTGDRCVAEMKERFDNDLGPNDCPDGIDSKQVDECLDAIRKESCSNPISTVQRLAECRTASLCVKPYGRPLL